MKMMHLERPVNSKYWSFSRDWTYIGQVIRTTERLFCRAINFGAREFLLREGYRSMYQCFEQENILIGEKKSVKDHLTYV